MKPIFATVASATVALAVMAGGAMAQGVPPQPQPAPAPAPAPQGQPMKPAGQMFEVVGVRSALNVRADGNPHAPVVGQLHPHDRVMVDRKSPDGRWSHISFGPDHHHQGWVASNYLAPAH